MKHFRLFVILFVMVLCTIPCYAQYSYEKYYKVDIYNTYITTKYNAELYELLQEEYSRMKNKPRDYAYSREYIDISRCRAKTIKNPTQLKVLRFTNTVKQQGFNAYIVVYKEKLWVINSSSVQDNTHIDECNAKIMKTKLSLGAIKYNHEIEKQKLYQEQYKIDEEINSEIAIYQQEYTDSLNYYNLLKMRLPKMRDSLVMVKEAEKRKIYKDWYNALPASTKKAVNLISITESGLSEPNSVGGCDYTLCYINKSKKTIKYLYWTGVVYNRVNDPISCEIRRTTTCKGVETGPIEPGNSGGGYWDCVIYNNTASTLRLSNIRITYMDGTSVTIAAADIKRLMEEPFTDLSVSIYDVRGLVMSDDECQNNIRLWQDKLDRLIRSGRTILRAKNQRYREIESQLEEVDAEIKKLNTHIGEIDSFLSFRSSYSVSAGGGPYTERPAFVTFGLECSGDLIFANKSVYSVGCGALMRIGSYSSLFNVTVGAKYQYSGYGDAASYDDNGRSQFFVHNRNINQFVFPIMLNCNVWREQYFSFYVGAGYEFTTLLSDKNKFKNTDPGFNEYAYYESSDYDSMRRTFAPSSPIVFHTGFVRRHCDWKILYFKYYVSNKKYVKGDRLAVGTAFTYYF